MRKIRSAIATKLRKKSIFIAGCIDGYKMYKHTKRYHYELQNEFVKRFFTSKQPKVVGGPFTGLRYENSVYFGPVTPRWLGTYEKELWPVIEQIVLFAPEEVIDIGAAEGYYSLGMAVLLPNTPIYSYETNPLSIWQQSRLKKLNGTKNLHIRRYCTKEQLIAHGRARIAVICDIEGAEMELFTPEVVAGLSTSLVLIEIHPYLSTSLTEVCQTLSDIFSCTHEIRRIFSIERVPEDWEFADRGAFSDEESLELMNEVRSQKQIWLFCEPRRTWELNRMHSVTQNIISR